MVEIKFPVSLPKFTDAQFERKQAEYVAKHGYYVSPPKLSDIIHIGTPREPGDLEWRRFKSSALGKTDPKRHSEINQLLDKKRARRDRMLASPTPTWAKNLASVMTLFDDINDTLGTIGVVMRIAARLAPKVLTRFFLGPVGWLFLAAEIAGLFLTVMRLPFACVSRKRTYERVRDLNPFSKKAKVRRARKMRRLRPSKGEMIELLQTTDNMFGIGLCLGPILGFGYDVLSGIVRKVKGQEVRWGTPPPERPKHIRPASRLLRNAPALHGAGDEMSEEDHLAFMIALNGATQALKPYIDEWHPIDQVDNFDNVLFEAPRPEHATTKFILAEVGIKDGQAIGWPGLDKDLVSWEDLWDHTQPIAAQRFMDFSIRNRNNYVGLCGAQNGDEFGTNMLLMLEGYETVEQETEPRWRDYGLFMSAGCTFLNCGSFGRGICWPPFEKCHSIQFGHQYLIVCGCMHPSLGFRGPMAGGAFTCTPCNFWVDVSMAPPGYQRWVTAGWIVGEGAWLELIRKGTIT